MSSSISRVKKNKTKKKQQTKHDFTSGPYPTGLYGDSVMCDYPHTASASGQMGGGVCVWLYM